MNNLTNQKIRILWIEDGTRVEIPQLAVPLYMKREYYLVITDNLTDAERKISEQSFEIVIFDLRLPPGTDERFRELSKTLMKEKKAQRLGLYLLLSYFGSSRVASDLKVTKPDWLTMDRVAILSVDPFIEPEVREALRSINFPEGRYKQKTAGMKRTSLLELVRQVLEHIEQ